MATHSSVLAWRIPGTVEPGGLPSMGSHRVGHDWSDLAAAAAFFTVQLSHPYMTTGKTIALTRRTFVGKVMPLLLNMLSRLVIIFLPRSKHLLILWLQSPSAVIWEPKKIKVWCFFHCFSIYFPWSDGGGGFHLVGSSNLYNRKITKKQHMLGIRWIILDSKNMAL